jgi:hypothetical protein
VLVVSFVEHTQDMTGNSSLRNQNPFSINQDPAIASWEMLSSWSFTIISKVAWTFANDNIAAVEEEYLLLCFFGGGGASFTV